VGVSIGGQAVPMIGVMATANLMEQGVALRFGDAQFVGSIFHVVEEVFPGFLGAGHFLCWREIQVGQIALFLGCLECSLRSGIKFSNPFNQGIKQFNSKGVCARRGINVNQLSATGIGAGVFYRINAVITGLAKSLKEVFTGGKRGSCFKVNGMRLENSAREGGLEARRQRGDQ
jgi:hypothetical protein